MKVQLNERNRLIVAILVVVALAVAFWMLLLGPTRDEATELGAEVSQLESSLSESRSVVATALQARKSFPEDYRQLVTLGKAVPGDDDTASLFVQVNKIAERTDNRLQLLELQSEGAEGEAPVASTPSAVAPSEGPGRTTAGAASPTEVAASTMPLGAKIGPAGLAVMPYKLAFDTDFFNIADFIGGLDKLVESENEELTVDGRLLTVNGFTLKASEDMPFPALKAIFSVTTYLVPPEEGVTAGVAPIASAPVATPASATTGETP